MKLLLHRLRFACILPDRSLAVDPCRASPISDRGLQLGFFGFSSIASADLGISSSICLGFSFIWTTMRCLGFEVSFAIRQ